MSDESLFDKLQLKDEKNLLIQGIPSTIEKQFIKLSFAKCITPLLKIKKIDFALVFAISKKQLCEILKEVTPVLQDNTKLWIAYPKLASKITSDLSRDCNWSIIHDYGFQSVSQVAIDNVWTAVRFKRLDKTEIKKTNFSAANPAEGIDYNTRSVAIPEELKLLFRKNKPAEDFFDSLSFTNRKEYVEWLVGAKKTETRSKRLEAVVEKLSTGKKNPSSR